MRISCTNLQYQGNSSYADRHIEIWNFSNEKYVASTYFPAIVLCQRIDYRLFGFQESIFRHTLAESATFPPCSETGMWFYIIYYINETSLLHCIVKTYFSHYYGGCQKVINLMKMFEF